MTEQKIGKEIGHKKEEHREGRSQDTKEKVWKEGKGGWSEERRKERRKEGRKETVQGGRKGIEKDRKEARQDDRTQVRMDKLQEKRGTKSKQGRIKEIK